MVRSKQRNELLTLTKKSTRLQDQINALNSLTDAEQIDSLEEQKLEVDNKIIQVDYDLLTEIELPLTEQEKGEWRPNQKACGEREAKHLLNQQKAFAIIIGQCTQRLQDKLHDDAQWETINRNQKPLELYTLIERTVMQQTGDEYPPSNLVNNLIAVLTLKQQNNQSNTQWYEKLNTRVDVAESVGVQFTNFPSLWEHCYNSRAWREYYTLTPDEQETIRNDSKERLLGYLLIVNSSNTATHESVKINLLEAFIAKRDEYPINRSKAIALLNKYDKRKPPPASSPSDGTAFAQKGKKKQQDKTKAGEKKDEVKEKKAETPSKHDKKFFADKECYICGKKGTVPSIVPKRSQKPMMPTILHLYRAKVAG